MVLTKTNGYVDAHMNTSGDGVIVSMCQYPVSGSTVITKEEAKQLADQLYKLVYSGLAQPELMEAA